MSSGQREEENKKTPVASLHPGTMASVKIFGSPTSTDMARVLTCLFEKELHFQLIRVDAFHIKEQQFEKLKIQVQSSSSSSSTTTTTAAAAININLCICFPPYRSSAYSGWRYSPTDKELLLSTGTSLSLVR